MSSPDEDHDRERRLDEAAAQYLELQAAGKTIDRQQWLGQYPDLADELADFLNDLDRLNPELSRLQTSVPAAKNVEGLETLYQGHHPPVKLGATTDTLLDSSSPSPRYRMRQFLARGGMGEVWVADDTRVGRQIAVKKIRDARNASSIIEERFLFESQIMGQLEHPCIVPLHDLGRDEAGDLYCVMKLVKGQSLKQRLESFHAAKSDDDWPRQVEFLRLLESFVSICRAVAYAHSRGVMHRDIKPDNIMLGSFGEALLLDWGLAKALDSPEESVSSKTHSDPVQLSAGSSTATLAGAIIGSPAYMAPEIAAGRSDIADARTDVYLLGATLYEILTGKPPRSGSSRLELIDLAQNTPPTPPRHIDRRIPRPLDAVCLRAMAVHQEARYETAAALAKEIENFLAGEPVAAYREPAAVRLGRWCRRHRRKIQRTLAGGLLLILVGLVWFSFQRVRELEKRETARKQLAEFRRLAEEAQFFAANTDAVSEHAPYYDPQRAIQLGNAALVLAGRWGDRGSLLPLSGERSALASELNDLLLVLANLQQQSEPTADSQSRAIALLDRAAAQRPGSRALHEIRSRCLRQLGRVAEADREADLARSPAAPLTARDCFLEGELQRIDGARAAGPSTSVSQDGPELGSVQRAIAAYQQALRLDPAHYWAQFQLARCYLRTQRGPEAVASLGTCIALRPETPWAYSVRGLAYGLMGQFPAAESDLTQALQLAPDFRPARLNRGFVNYLQHKDQEALSELDSVLQPPADSVLIEAAFYRAQINNQRGEYATALRDCELFLDQRPNFAPAHALAARIHFRQGEDSRGINEVDRLLSAADRSRFDPQSPTVKIARGRALREVAIDLDRASQQHVLRLALQEFESAGDARVDQDIAAVKDLLGLVGEAIEKYSERLAIAPSDIATRKQRGWAYLKLQRYELAATDFVTTLEQAPEDAEAHTGLGYVLASRGDGAASELEAVKAVLYGANGYLVLHNVACIHAELAHANTQQRVEHENLALTYLERAVMLARQNPGGADEIEQIRAEPAFHDSLKTRPEFRRLLGGAMNR